MSKRTKVYTLILGICIFLHSSTSIVNAASDEFSAPLDLSSITAADSATGVTGGASGGDGVATAADTSTSTAATTDPNTDESVNSTASSAASLSNTNSTAASSPSSPTSTTNSTSSTKNPTTNNEGQCIDFEESKGFNAFFYTTYQNPSSDIQGRLAVGGDAILGNGFSCGDQLHNQSLGLRMSGNIEGGEGIWSILGKDDVSVEGIGGVGGGVGGACGRDIIVVAGNSINWENGRNFGGHILIQNPTPTPTSNTNSTTNSSNSGVSPNVLENGCQIIKGRKLLDFEQIKQKHIHLSQYLSSLPSTVSASIDSSLQLTFNINSDVGTGGNIKVYNAPTRDFFGTSIKSITPLQLPQHQLLLINIPGPHSSLTNLSLEGLKNTNVLFHFPNSTYLLIDQVGVEGSIFAPNADVEGRGGRVEGYVVANSWCGKAQINMKDLPRVCNSQSSQQSGQSPVAPLGNVQICQARPMGQGYGQPPMSQSQGSYGQQPVASSQQSSY